MNLLFPTQAINELAQEFKLLRKDIQAIRSLLERIELHSNRHVNEPSSNERQKSLSPTSPHLKPYEK